MTHEKTLSLQTGRSVKIIAQMINQSDTSELDIDVLIKEPSEAQYHPPIGITHPKYWKLKRLDSQKSRLMQIAYSGLTEKQLRNLVRELKQMPASIQ